MPDPRFPERPDRPEFWRLAGIVSRHDSRLDALTGGAKEAEWQAIMGQYVPTDVAAYVAFQRALRAVGAVTRGDVVGNFHELARLSAVWLDGFAAGAAYARGEGRGG